MTRCSWLSISRIENHAESLALKSASEISSGSCKMTFVNSESGRSCIEKLLRGFREMTLGDEGLKSAAFGFPILRGKLRTPRFPVRLGPRFRADASPQFKLELLCC